MTKLSAPAFIRFNGETKQILSVSVDTDMVQLHGVFSSVVSVVHVSQLDLTKISSDVTNFSPENILAGLGILYSSMGEENRSKINTYFIEQEKAKSSSDKKNLVTV